MRFFPTIKRNIFTRVAPATIGRFFGCSIPFLLQSETSCYHLIASSSSIMHLFMYSDCLESAHHPFTAPYPGEEELVFTYPQKVRIVFRFFANKSRHSVVQPAVCVLIWSICLSTSPFVSRCKLSDPGSFAPVQALREPNVNFNEIPVISEKKTLSPFSFGFSCESDVFRCAVYITIWC